MSRSLIGPLTKADAWIGAADTLDPTTVAAVIRRLSRIASDEAVEAAALPDALLSVAVGHPIGTSCRLAVRTAAIDIRRSEAARTERERNAALLAAGEPLSAPLWETARLAMPANSRALLDSLAAHLLSQPRVWERLSSGSVKVNGALLVAAWALPIPPSKRKATEQRSNALLLAAGAWADASVALGNTDPTTEARKARAAAALRWIKRGHSNRVGRVAGSANGSEVRVTRRLSVSAPFTAPDTASRVETFGPLTESGSGLSRLVSAPLRSVSYRPVAPVKRIRSQRVTDGVANGVSFGGGGAVGMPKVADEARTLLLPNGSEVANEWHPSQYGAPLGHSDRKAASRDGEYVGQVRDTRDCKAVGRVEREAWEDALAAGRVGVCPTVDDDGCCQCPRTRTRGKACERIATETRDQYATRSQRARLLGEPTPPESVLWLHPLSRCEQPSDDGRCGCSRKAGVLVWVASSPESAGTLRHPSQPRRTR